uniref:Coiled-coil domain containing 179 n=3 Tax=Sus scrofa TaxID=9823 RepID=A0A8D0V774_PIG
MCLRWRDDEAVQVNPEGSKWHHPSRITENQSTDKRVERMQNLRKRKMKFRKRFARPAPVPEPGLLWPSN